MKINLLPNSEDAWKATFESVIDSVFLVLSN